MDQVNHSPVVPSIIARGQLENHPGDIVFVLKSDMFRRPSMIMQGHEHLPEAANHNETLFEQQDRDDTTSDPYIIRLSNNMALTSPPDTAKPIDSTQALPLTHYSPIQLANSPSQALQPSTSRNSIHAPPPPRCSPPSTVAPLPLPPGIAPTRIRPRCRLIPLSSHTTSPP